MTKIESYKEELSGTQDWIQYLHDNSNLPGPRANLELMRAAVDVADETFIKQCVAFDEYVAPTNSPGEFVAMCGVVGLGKLISQGKLEYYSQLRMRASDLRWRVREGVAFALQMVGEGDFDGLTTELNNWKSGNPYEKRAVVAGLCEPSLLKRQESAETVLDILKEIMESVPRIDNKSDEAFKALKKGLGYGLSVAIVAYPEKGKQVFETLLSNRDKDVQWILKENLKKNRLLKMDENWVDRMKNNFG